MCVASEFSSTITELVPYFPLNQFLKLSSIDGRPEFHFTNLKETTPLEGTTLYKETRWILKKSKWIPRGGQEKLNQRQFNSILADLRFTVSPAPFRCTIGELTGPAAFSIENGNCED